jgi:ADP-ribose pyrophosphatase YjhB (NUDIX family)
MPAAGIVARLRATIGHDLLQLPSAAALTFDARGRLLLIRNADDGRWAVPGGCIEPGESPEEAVEREVREETGLVVRPKRLLGVFGGPRFLVRYPNGDETSYVTVAFECSVVGGALQPDGEEALEARFVAADEIDSIEIGPLSSELLRRIGPAFERETGNTWSWTPAGGNRG